MNCPNCGRELLEGEYCNCAANQPNPQAQQSSQQPPYYNPMPVINPEPSKAYPPGYKIKKKYVAVILAAALGFLGIHNFYLENKEKGLAQVLLSTVGSLIVVGPVISLIWSLVEAVQLFTETINADANGFKIQTFDEALKDNR